MTGSSDPLQQLIIATIGGGIGAFITSVVQVFLGRRQLQIADKTAEAALVNAKAAETTAVSSATHREEELRRGAIADLCKIQVQRLETLRAALAELAVIARPSSEPDHIIEKEDRRRGLSIALQLKMAIYPTSPLQELMQNDLATIREHLKNPNAPTLLDGPLWTRYFENAMRLLGDEERRIKEQLVEGHAIDPRKLQPEMTWEESYRLYPDEYSAMINRTLAQARERSSGK